MSYLKIEPLVNFMQAPPDMDDIYTMQDHINNQIRTAAAECDNKCAANPLPPGYYYGPLEIKYDHSDLVTNMITVTVYRNIFKTAD